MPIKQEVTDWLKSLPLGEEARKVLEAEVQKKEVHDAIGKSVMAPADYSRAMDKLRDQEQQIRKEAEEATFKANNLLQQNVAWRNKNEAAVKAAIEDAQKKGYILQTIQTKLQTLAEQGLIDPREFDVAAPGNGNLPAHPAGPAKRFLTEEEMAERQLQQEKQFAFAMANFEDIADQHKRLFKEPLKRTELIQDMLKSGKALEDVWKEKFKVDEKLKELEEEGINARIQKAIEEDRVKRLSEQTASPGGGPAPILGTDHIVNILKPVRSGGVSDAVRAAVESFNRGDFRQNEPQPPKA
jgi:hypothetical protein